jgi:hypothetical protein
MVVNFRGKLYEVKLIVLKFAGSDCVVNHGEYECNLKNDYKKECVVREFKAAANTEQNNFFFFFFSLINLLTS